MKKVIMHIKSANISGERIKQLADAPLKRRVPKKGESATYNKIAINDLLTIVALIIGLIGSIIIIPLLAESDSTFILIICSFLCIFVFSLLYAILKGTYMSIVGYVKLLFRDVRNETSEEAVRMFFKVVLIGDDTQNFNEKSVSYSYGIFQRMIPEIIAVDNEKFDNYLVNFRNLIQQTVDNEYRKFYNKLTPPDSYNYRIILSLDNEEREGFIAHKSKAMVKVIFFEPPSDANSGYVEFDILLELLLIKSGKFWFVADPMPAYTVIDE
jgi:hypothetical protein